MWNKICKKPVLLCTALLMFTIFISADQVLPNKNQETNLVDSSRLNQRYLKDLDFDCLKSKISLYLIFIIDDNSYNSFWSWYFNWSKSLSSLTKLKDQGVPDRLNHHIYRRKACLGSKGFKFSSTVTFEWHGILDIVVTYFYGIKTDSDT